MDRSSFCSCVFALFLDTSSIALSIDIFFLDTFLDRWLDTSLCRELLRIYIKDKCDPDFIFSWSLSRYLYLLTSQFTLSHSKPLFKWFSSFFKVSLHLVSFDSLIFMHFILWNLSFWRFCKIWGFSKSKRFLCNFWDGFWRFNFKNFMHCIPCAL